MELGPGPLTPGGICGHLEAEMRGSQPCVPPSLQAVFSLSFALRDAVAAESL